MFPLKSYLCISLLLLRDSISVESAFVKPPIQNVTAQCFASRAQFASFCQQLNGVTNGGRCYFFAAINVGWTASWAVCKAYGASLAQIHTRSEYNTISDYAKVTFGNTYHLTLLALADQQTRGQTCKLFANSTFWYSSETDKMLNLPIEKGYLYRYHRCEGIDLGDEAPPRCLTLFHYVDSDWPMNFGDWICDSPPNYDALCEFTNSAQTFSKSLGTCIGEDPIEIVEGQDPNGCATHCSQRLWCRSFNFILGNPSQCELFTWSIADTNVTKMNAQCHHYSYIV